MPSVGRQHDSVDIKDLAMSKLARPKKPNKPYPLFPLTAHNNGQWCQKIHGKVHFIGVWQDPQAVLGSYLRQAADLHAGRMPTRQETIPAGGMTFKDVCNHHLTYQIAIELMRKQLDPVFDGTTVLPVKARKKTG